ncbi:hypothetical protein PR202_gb09760 [Eleusine coracana subsp. coracana]|uniref:Uncharacterized protein n=1 Tax=Eleusine coracana subsp. coracana TaxID=191504 RepID=A0AAV5EI65_ELECO|nr:hypothetical protein PR202_gb09760 [Eleusine coracana subsp. coracana]
MAIMMTKFVLPLTMLALFMLLAASASARLLDGDQWSGGEHPMVQFVKHRYLQQLAGAGHSCGSYDGNNPRCHHG